MPLHSVDQPHHVLVLDRFENVDLELEVLQFEFVLELDLFVNLDGEFLLGVRAADGHLNCRIGALAEHLQHLVVREVDLLVVVRELGVLAPEALDRLELLAQLGALEDQVLLAVEVVDDLEDGVELVLVVLGEVDALLSLVGVVEGALFELGFEQLLVFGAGLRLGELRVLLQLGFVEVFDDGVDVFGEGVVAAFLEVVAEFESFVGGGLVAGEAGGLEVRRLGAVFGRPDIFLGVELEVVGKLPLLGVILGAGRLNLLLSGVFILGVFLLVEIQIKFDRFHLQLVLFLDGLGQVVEFAADGLLLSDVHVLVAVHHLLDLHQVLVDALLLEFLVGFLDVVDNRLEVLALGRGGSLGLHLLRLLLGMDVSVGGEGDLQPRVVLRTCLLVLVVGVAAVVGDAVHIQVEVRRVAVPLEDIGSARVVAAVLRLPPGALRFIQRVELFFKVETTRSLFGLRQRGRLLMLHGAVKLARQQALNVQGPFLAVFLLRLRTARLPAVHLLGGRPEFLRSLFLLLWRVFKRRR